MHRRGIEPPGPRFPPHEALVELARKIQQITCHVYEVLQRDERPDEIVVRVAFVGEDEGGSEP